MVLQKAKYFWTRAWMRYAGLSHFGRISTRLATWFAPPYYGRCYLASFNPKGYIAPGAIVHHNSVHFGRNVFIGDRVVIFQDKDGGSVEFGDRVHIYGETFIQTGSGGSLKIGENSHIHPRCQFSAYKSNIYIGSEVQIAPNCAFYPYNHGIAAGKPIQEQPINSKGDIFIDDDAWLGFGVIVLNGVRIGKGAVVGAGSVVSDDIIDGGIAVGMPARVVKMRGDISQDGDGEENRKN
jgi:acetyltransferase-like isoleucine patch superfamily enzyme